MNGRIMIAAMKSGSGKTICTMGLIAALKKRGKDVSAVKSGPDYIDPMFHRMVLGTPSANLDTFFTDREAVLELYDASHEITVIEGVMGLYDGLGGIREEGSAYDLARGLNCPIILVIDGKGMGKSIAAVIAGMKSFDNQGLIKGVILNRVSAGYYGTLKKLIEDSQDMKVLGYIKEDEACHLESRHLGLVTPDVITDIRERIHRLSELMEESLDIDGIIELAGKAGPIDAGHGEKDLGKRFVSASDNKVRLAVARDEAFCFYYEENLRILKSRGIELVEFSPLHDKALPENIQGVLLGGGYPELFADRLSDNASMLESIRDADKKRLLIIAECGGYMYLCNSITLPGGERFFMAGVINTDCSYKGKLVRFGYVTLKDSLEIWIPKDKTAKGHEFHYYDCDDNGSSLIVTKASTGKSYEGCYVSERMLAGFPHLYYPSCPEIADRIYNKLCEIKRY